MTEPIFAVMVPMQSDGCDEWQMPEIPVWFDSEAGARAWARAIGRQVTAGSRGCCGGLCTQTPHFAQNHTLLAYLCREAAWSGILPSMGNTVHARPEEPFTFFFNPPKVTTAHLTAYFKGPIEISTEGCGIRVGGGYDCTGVVPKKAPPGTYKLMQLTAKDGGVERDLPKEAENVGPTFLIVEPRSD